MTIDEKTLRETRDDLVQRVTDQQRLAGGMPDVRRAETFIDPILNKVDRSSDERHRAPSAPKPKSRTMRAGEWYGEAEHSPRPGTAQSRIAAPLPGETMRLTTSVLGDYSSGPSGIAPVGSGPLAPVGAPKQSPVEKLLRDSIKQLWRHPDFKVRLQKVALSNLDERQKDKAYGAILNDAFRLFGDPRKPDGKKIVVGGRALRRHLGGLVG